VSHFDIHLPCRSNASAVLLVSNSLMIQISSLSEPKNHIFASGTYMAMHFRLSSRQVQMIPHHRARVDSLAIPLLFIASPSLHQSLVLKTPTLQRHQPLQNFSSLHHPIKPSAFGLLKLGLVWLFTKATKVRFGM
jgi:hypothetical protein